MKELLLEMKNKVFAYKCIEILISAKREEDIHKLTDPGFCKSKFDMNFAILQEISVGETISEKIFFDNSGNRRYYPQPVTAFGKRYIICNDWYYNCKTNKRDTRTNFVNWILK